MNKILDNLNKYIKSDLHNLLLENINHINAIRGVKLLPSNHFSQWHSINIELDLCLNGNTIFCEISFDKPDCYYLTIKNTGWVNLHFILLASQEEVFRIINEFSEEYLKGNVIYETSYFKPKSRRR